ncbi:MAG: phage holin family protein [Erysipelotrichaceae bacterium]|nr:phage holin family protein [Erysipelotrichaceae bacterium]
MKKLISFLVINMLSLYVVSHVINGVYISDFGTLMALAVVLGILNATLKPVFKLLSFPITFVTLGLFTLVINGLVLSLAFTFVSGAAIYDFPTAMLASIVLSIVNGFFNSIFGDK